ncbi:MAG: GNAT family N-acetyltransferase [Acidobacteriota bacterium]|nr:GNAT family N-acetyltransferase [Acidobacteriota bacterium]
MKRASSVTLRAASDADALAVATIHLATWRAAYRGIIPDSYLDGLDEETRASRYTFDSTSPDDPQTWIALEGEEIVGFVSLGPARDDELKRGEVYALYVAPRSWRLGIGSILMARAEEELRGRGFTGALLWVLRDNDRGRRFYEASDWRFDGHELVAQFDGHDVVEVRYVKSLGAP